MTGPRRWARRAMLSALAGSGLTAASLGAPFSSSALGGEAAGTPPGPGESPSTPSAETAPQPSAPAPGVNTGQQESGQTSTTTPTAPAPSSTPPTPTTPSQPAPAPAGEAPTAPTVVVQRKQKTTRGGRRARNLSETGATPAGGSVPGKTWSAGTQSGPQTLPAGAPNGVAPAPQTVAGPEGAGTLASLLAGSAVSAQALDFYRIPLFLLPVYRAAAIQYDVPWQILAAINEVETNYGTDQSVSTAGAVGWMQFMPPTWAQYGVDAVDAGYADPYNPIDAIFAAARYLHAAGAAHNLHRAILAYNHSQAYVESVLLRARLIASYPRSVIATLTGLVDGRPPTPGARLAPGPAGLVLATGTGAESGSATPGAAATSPSSGPANATAGAVPTASPAPTGTAPPPASAAQASGVWPIHSGHATAGLPGSKRPPSPQALAARAEAAANAPAKASQLTDLLGRPGAPVVAVQDGRVVHLGRSHTLGRYLVLRDIYGDIFTYAGLGDIAPRYRRPEPRLKRPALGAGADGSAQAGSSKTGEAVNDPAPTGPASAGRQPLTLKVKSHHAAHAAASPTSAPVEPEAETAPPGMGKVRLFAHPHNPIARAAAAGAAKSQASQHGRWLSLRAGSLVTQGTVLGHLGTPPSASTAQLRFAIRPAGDSATIAPGAVLANWRQLRAAEHPKGSGGEADLFGATAADVFSMSRSELERSVLSDPGIQLETCTRGEIAAGGIDRRVLAVLEFLSRSGLQPTVSGLGCAHRNETASGLLSAHRTGYAVDISAVNGVPVAGHQGQGSITDTTIRALLTLRGRFAPHQIISLMRYPEAANTLALAAEWDHIHIGFEPARASARPFGTAARASAAGSRSTLQSPLAVTGDLSRAEWDRLISRIAALPQPTVAVKPSPAAIRDPQAAPTNHDLGARGLGSVG